ncbi:hypothetical protein PFDSM3638_04310 [Pyrococcus furiosus DSM 3638]|uniref:Uncharacterized protein n=2 Tax=Pyrococcus furiosus TaxID=2261 RepID=A0A5C0XRR0_PYRFU|nr:MULTISPECIES: hypothetical protein [Pyrococcus]AFN03651.1 hypothetical protein PFC_03510 [Pyrococcus furiosus COM1]MDK2869807.1 hypothetical protein [Pyrococcus sp.]QEK78534.1 hypothetical protein PFDSM3638_04310 [Pyrococcus furiosus DSM 3638]
MGTLIIVLVEVITLSVLSIIGKLMSTFVFGGNTIYFFLGGIGFGIVTSTLIAINNKYYLQKYPKP